MGKKIVIVSQSHVCRNPRVAKEAIALSQSGYDVTILTAIYSEELLKEDSNLLSNTSIQYEFYSDLRRKNIYNFIQRLKRRSAAILNSSAHIESKSSLGFGIGRLKKMCKSANADLFIMHQELPTVIGCEMVKKYKLAFDLEDWYSEDLLQNARNSRPIGLLKWAEKTAIESGTCTYTTSKSMARALMLSFHTKSEPKVIYNTFNSGELGSQSETRQKPLRLYWFSQTIGPGRGLEFFIECLAQSSASFHLTLRGNIEPAYKEALTIKLASKDKLVFLKLINNEEILADMNNFDFGLALEPASPPNKNLTISNKFFHYMAGGLPVIASNTSGHSEIGVKHPDFIFLYRNDDPASLIALLNNLGEIVPFDLSRLKNKSINCFRDHYSWEKESLKLIHLISQALETSG